MPTDFHGGIAHGNTIFGSKQRGDPVGTTGDNDDNASSGFSWQGPPATSMSPKQAEGVMKEILVYKSRPQKGEKRTKRLMKFKLRESPILP